MLEEKESTRRVVYSNEQGENIGVGFEEVVTTERGAFFYKNGGELVLFLPITKRFIIAPSDWEEDKFYKAI